MKKSLFLLIGLTLLTACGDKRSQRAETPDSQEVQYAMPQGKMHFEGHGDEQWFAYGALNGVEGFKANGVAQAHQFEDGKYLHTANVNIEPAADGYFYEGWIIKGPSVISTGHLSNYFGDSRHSLRFESNEDFSGHLKVVITLEPDDGNPAPAEHVAQGTMKVTKR